MQGTIEAEHSRVEPVAPERDDRPLAGGWWIVPALLAGLAAWVKIGQMLWHYCFA